MAKKITKKTSKRTGTTRYRILALDGGGIRGIITAHWLKNLEEMLGSPVGDHFDLVAGTSTGSILACGVAMRIPAADIVQMYRQYGREVFPSSASRLWSRLGRTLSQGVSAPKYDDKGLERVLRRQFGDKRFGDLPSKSPILLVTTYNTLTRQAIVFKSSRNRYDNLPIWEAAKASSSAPTYFPAHVTGVLGAAMPLIDGGVVANNPTACAIAEGVRENSQRTRGKVPLERFVVASLGTGHNTRPITAAEAREWGAVEWAIPVIDVLMDGNSDVVDYIARNLIPTDRYFRLQTPLDNAFDDLDDASQTNLNALINIADHYLDSKGGSTQLKKLAALIK